VLQCLPGWVRTKISGPSAPGRVNHGAGTFGLPGWGEGVGMKEGRVFCELKGRVGECGDRGCEVTRPPPRQIRWDKWFETPEGNGEGRCLSSNLKISSLAFTKQLQLDLWGGLAS
jgi:hypothetical protein